MTAFSFSIVVAAICGIYVVAMICTALRDEKRQRSIGEREGYIRGYRDGRNGSPPEDW